MLEYARDYNGMGATAEEKHHCLNTAMLAWNLSLFPEGQREEQTESALRQLTVLNPGSKGLESLKHNLRILIDKKLAEFPEIKKLMVNARISVVDGKEVLHVTSIDFTSKA